MRKQNRFHYAVTGVLAFAVLFMALGFAAYSQVVSNNGDGVSALSSKFYSVHFDDSSYQTGDGSIEPFHKDIANNRLDLDIEEMQPGDFYLASVEVLNDGSIDSVLESVEILNTSEKLDYSVIINDDKFTKTTREINTELASTPGSNRDFYVVRIENNSSESVNTTPSIRLNYKSTQ